MNKMSVMDKISDTLNSFWDNTTLHGINQVMAAKKYILKCMWTVLTLISLCIMLWMITTQMKAYFQYSVNTHFDIKYKSKREFPAVTICNLNPVRRSMLNGTGLASFLDDNLQEQVADPFKEYVDVVEQMSQATKMKLGHQFKDLIIDCKWGDDPCPDNIWTPLYSYRFGNCFTFNLGINRSAPSLIAKQAGNTYGLHLQLNLEADEYVGALTRGTGAIVHINNRVLIPEVEDQGIRLGPGSEHAIQIQSATINRLREPYTNCTSSNHNIIYHGYNYSVGACVNSCHARLMLEKCGCVHYKYPLKPRCRKANKSQAVCMDNVFEIIESTTTDALCTNDNACPPMCLNTNFKLDISSSKWPNKNYLPYLRHSMQNHSAYSVTGSLDETRENILEMFVSYKTFLGEEMTQVEAITFSTLCGDIGGGLGLFLGASILTTLEFIQLAINLLMALCNRSSKRIKVSKE